MRSGAMPSPPGLPEFDLPMIFGDAMAGLGFQSGVARLAFAFETEAMSQNPPNLRPDLAPKARIDEAPRPGQPAR